MFFGSLYQWQLLHGPRHSAQNTVLKTGGAVWSGPVVLEDSGFNDVFRET